MWGDYRLHLVREASECLSVLGSCQGTIRDGSAPWRRSPRAMGETPPVAWRGDMTAGERHARRGNPPMLSPSVALSWRSGRVLAFRRSPSPLALSPRSPLALWSWRSWRCPRRSPRCHGGAGVHGVTLALRCPGVVRLPWRSMILPRIGEGSLWRSMALWRGAGGGGIGGGENNYILW